MNEIEYRSILLVDGYRAGNDGSIWSCLNQGGHEPRITDKWRKMSPGIDPMGYQRLALYENGSKYPCSVHVLVLSAFKGPPPFEGAMCRHLDGNPSNNRPENLEWGTCEENAADKDHHGRHARGEDSVISKLKQWQVEDIKIKLMCGYTMAELGEEYKVSTGTIFDIKHGNTWAHVEI